MGKRLRDAGGQDRPGSGCSRGQRAADWRWLDITPAGKTHLFGQYLPEALNDIGSFVREHLNLADI